ncbi:MAG: phenylalanine--tRNA ligase subunit alpha [Sandaracinaceae bacterium]|nr:phenylalanine--tRNA ligase subunit alpha [Sandaracinaceae bacterium]
MEQAQKEIEEALRRLEATLPHLFTSSRSEAELRAENAKLLGPEGEVTRIFRLFPKIEAERRKELGKRANAIKSAIEQAFQQKLALIKKAQRQAELECPPIDISLPGRGVGWGSLHPISATMAALIEVFESLGFEYVEVPEIDFAENNFGRLAFPPDHPAADMQDSFFTRSEGSGNPQAVVLRTHTTTVQAHFLRSRPPPMALVTGGAVYRRDDDATHSPMFHQIDGFWVDRDVCFAHLHGLMRAFVERIFGAGVPIRFRPSYFPFVEPGAELDIGCTFCRPWERGAPSEQCKVCKGTGWLEVLGCGMIHPLVLEMAGVSPKEWRGIAWGMGVDRIAMLRYGISDIRMLYENDMRFLEQL